ncbi:MAG: metal-sulfur cluster assembly factor [Rickettsiales bacterium]|jgi:metal-sulfur cluster biosynthetic enzyme|nr:metal-sulfur cluster assembly factor [Rickettsiales bacterium]
MNEVDKKILENFEEILPKEFPIIKKTSGAKLPVGACVLNDKQMIVNALKTVVDPDINVDVYNLGLVYKYDLRADGDVFVVMTLTSPTCPYANELIQASADAIADLEGVGYVEVEVAWLPKWDISMLSPEAKFQLEIE